MATKKKAAPKKDERANLTDIKDELADEEPRLAVGDPTVKAEKTGPKKNERVDLTDIKEELADGEPHHTEDGPTVKAEKTASKKDEMAKKEPGRTEEPKKPNETWKKRIKNIRKMKDRVHTSMVDGSKKAEKWHKKAASWPLQKISKIDRLKQISVDVDEVQAKTIAHGYDILRTAVDNIDDIYDEILSRAEKRTMTA